MIIDGQVVHLHVSPFLTDCDAVDAKIFTQLNFTQCLNNIFLTEFPVRKCTYSLLLF